MIYFSIFIVILFLAIFELGTNRNMREASNIVFVIITLLACFRYGVGQDYFSYMYIYNIVPNLNNPNFKTFEIHGEYGYKFIQGLFKMYNINYSVFIFIFAIITMYLFYFYIKRNSNSYMVSLLIFYSMYYFTFINSGIRQGLTIGLFLTILLPILKKRHYLKYIMFTLLFSLMHTSIIVVLILPLIYFNFSKKSFLVIVICAAMISFINIGILLKPFGSIYISYQSYIGAKINILGLMSRITIFGIVMILYKSVGNKINLEIKDIMKYYIVGFIIYIAFVRNDLIAARLNVYFKCFEIILIPNLLKVLINKQRKILISYIICIVMMVMWVKEINAALNQGNYFIRNNVLKYPYVTIFNKEDIYSFRPINYNYGNIY